MKNNLVSFTKLQLKRLLVPTVLTTILAFINGPMALILAQNNPYTILRQFMYFSYVNKLFVYAGIFLIPLLYTRMLYDYLFDEKIADFNLSLPVSRKTQYLSGFLATSIATAIPVIVNLLITLALYVTKIIPLPTLYVQGISSGHIFAEILANIIAILIVTATCSFVAVFVGTRLEHFSYSIALLFLPLAVTLIIQASLSMYIYGLQEIRSLDNFMYLSPVATMFKHAFIWENRSLLPGVFQGTLNESFLRIGICAAIAAILFVIGLKVSNKRRGELSGRKGEKSIVSVVVDIVLSYGIGLVIALFFQSIMNLEEPNTLFILMTAVFSILVYIIDNFVTTQNIKNLKKNVSTMVIILMLSVLAFLCLVTNGFGYERKLPQVNQIDHIVIDYDGYMNSYDRYGIDRMAGKEVKSIIDDPQLIEDVRELHLKALKEMPIPSDYVRVSYVTKNGKEVNRYFEPAISDIKEVYKNLHNSESFNRSAFNSFYLNADSFDHISINTLGKFHSIQEKDLTTQQKEKLLDTICRDILDNINSESVMDKNVHIATLEYYAEIESMYHDSKEVVSVTEYIRSDYARTIALLKEFGIEFPEAEKSNVTEIQFEYARTDEIALEKFDGYKQIPENKITPELLDDIFSKAYPADHSIAQIQRRNNFVFFYVSYWNEDNSNPYSRDYCIEKSDMENILAKYNITL